MLSEIMSKVTLPELVIWSIGWGILGFLLCWHLFFKRFK
jgi:hypothetical protein